MRLVQKVALEPGWPEKGFTAEGREIRLADVEAQLNPHDRANVYFLRGKTRVYPWREAGYYVDDAGEPLAAAGPRALSRSELASLGMTDDALWAEHGAYYDATPPKPGARDTPDEKVRRGRVYAEVMGAWHGNVERKRGR